MHRSWALWRRSVRFSSLGPTFGAGRSHGAGSVEASADPGGQLLIQFRADAIDLVESVRHHRGGGQGFTCAGQ